MMVKLITVFLFLGLEDGSQRYLMHTSYERRERLSLNLPINTVPEGDGPVKTDIHLRTLESVIVHFLVQPPTVILDRKN